MLDLDPSGATLTFYAVVNKLTPKNKQGKKGKGKKARSCYECGAGGHIAG